MTTVVPLPAARLLSVLRILDKEGRMATPDLARCVGLDEPTLTTAAAQLGSHGLSLGVDGVWSGSADLLDESVIEALVVARTRRPCMLAVLGITGSTNDDAREALAQASAQSTQDNRIRVILAEGQEKGRGRRGRAWQSPVASNVYLTQIESLRGGPESARGLSLVVGVAVAEALERLHSVDVSLKWPNDLLVGHRKLGGILVELSQAATHCHALIGVGINVRVPAYAAHLIDQAWVDLESCGEFPPRRSEVAAALVSSIADALETFRASGFDARLRARWQTRDPFFGKRVHVSGQEPDFVGTAQGIDADGALLVDTDAGRRVISAGEVSIRLVEEAS